MSSDDVGVPSDDVGVPTNPIPTQLASVLAPIDRRAFGVAIGTACGLGIFLLTAAHLLLRPEPGLNLELLGHYFPGYSLSWAGALAGFAWAFCVGFCTGWFLAFIRNLGIAAGSSSFGGATRSPRPAISWTIYDQARSLTPLPVRYSIAAERSSLGHSIGTAC